MAIDRNRQVIGDYFTLQRGTTYKSALLGRPGPVLLGLATIERNGGFRTDSLRTYGGESPGKLLVHPGQLFLSLKDVTQSADLLGAVARLPLDHPAGRLTQDTVKLEPIGTNVPLNYLYWLLRSPEYRDYCRAHATGTTNLGLAREDFLSFPAPEPTATQGRIAGALNALEEKIELNRRMNETLEAIERSIFMHYEYEEDWPELLLEQVCTIYDGPHATPQLVDTGPIFLGISNLNEGSLVLSDVAHVTDDDFVIWTRRVTPAARDVVFSYETRLGQAALIPDNLKCCLGRRMGLLRPKAGMTEGVILLRAYLAAGFQEVIRQRTIHGSTVDRIPLREMGQFPIRLPRGKAIDRLAAELVPLRAKIEHNQRTSRTLAALRDTLLPKLISGELRVKAAEKIVEAVA